eukprot:Nk52_evm99s226 gene=Nk52_evmTU99s226
MESLQENTIDVVAQQKNVFVTQLGGERDEVKDRSIRKFPLIKETPKSLLKQGRDTLQSTLLLTKKKEMDNVEDMLDAKRSDFAKRMEESRLKHLGLKQKQAQIRARVSKFEKFLRDNDAKRQRAIEKYHAEMQQKEQKEIDLKNFYTQLETLKKQHAQVAQTLYQYEMYEKYLQQTVNSLPADYLESQEPHIKDIMMRYNTLKQTNEDLVLQVQKYYDEVEKKQQKIFSLEKEKTNKVMVFNSTLAIKQKALETIKGKVANLEQEITEKEKGTLYSCRLLGEIKLSIINMYVKCETKEGKETHDRDSSLTVLKARLEDIQRKVLDLDQVTNLVRGLALDKF